MTNPQVHSLLREPCGVYPAEEDQPMPTLDEAVPPSCCWHGGIVLSLFVNNLPQDGPIYARFGYHVVKTVRVHTNPSKVAHRSNPGSEGPWCAGMQGPGSGRPM